MKYVRRTVFVLLLLFVLFGWTQEAKAQDFYGEGNVLIAVDMAAFGQNEEVDYPEGTLGTLRWGEEAGTGVSSRAPFANQPYTDLSDAAPKQVTDYFADYKTETVYEVGQTVFLPYDRTDDPDYKGWYLGGSYFFPEEVFSPDGEPLFLIAEKYSQNQKYYMPFEQAADGSWHVCADFLEIECVAAAEHATLWQYTGRAYSSRTDFDKNDYMSAVNLTEQEKQYFTYICDNAYTIESQVFGDARFEDYYGDRDGKAAFVFIDLHKISQNAGFHRSLHTFYFDFDCLVLNTFHILSGDEASYAEGGDSDYVADLIHELCHAVERACTGYGDYSDWLGEAFAQRAVDEVLPDSHGFLLQYNHHMTIMCSRLRMMPGMIWEAYPNYMSMPYALGMPFLEYIERRTTGEKNGKLWTAFFTEQTPNGGFTTAAFASYVQRITGESLEAWMAQFMAAVVVGAEDGPYCMGTEDMTRTLALDRNVFLRDCREYGLYLGVIDESSAADALIVKALREDNDTYAVQGGGTTYAWRNDAGGRIEITGADDRWYFFAVTMDLSDPDAYIEISSAQELARIGYDPAYPLGGKYKLTKDIDLQGSPDDPWMPIGSYHVGAFSGVFDGQGHTIKGLYIDSEEGRQGLFGTIEGNALVENLTVTGFVSGGYSVGGIAGLNNGAEVKNCICRVEVKGISDVGGVVGYVSGGRISGCTAYGSVAGDSDCGGILGDGNHITITCCVNHADITTEDGGAGGIAGRSEYDGEIRECWNTGDISGVGSVGGVAGILYNGGVVRDCYNTGTVSGERLVGGIVGDGWVNDPHIEYCYSFQEDLPVAGNLFEGTIISSYARSDTQTGDGYLSTEEFGKRESFEGWDFREIWIMQYGLRPTLRHNPEMLEPVIKPYLPAPTSNAGKTEENEPENPIVPVVITEDEKIDVSEFFTDVSMEDWFYACVDWAVNEGVMNGVDEGTFDPNGTGTRAMIVTILWRLAGEPDAEQAGFIDVPSGAWYEKAVNWAAQNGIVLGTSEEAFSPDAPITREQLAVILYRYAKSLGLGFTDTWAFPLDYTDADEISDYAREAVSWMVMQGILNGMGDGTIAPQNEATRVQIASVFMAFCTQIG